MSSPLSGVDKLGVVSCVIEDLGVDVKIVGDQVCFLKAPQPFQGEEPDISRTRSHKIDFSFFHRGSMPNVS
jgi:hypothetical protein